MQIRQTNTSRHTNEAPLGFTDQEKSAWSLGVEYGMSLVAQRVRYLESVVGEFLDAVEEPPEANCSCHLAPPCCDCVNYAGTREAFAKARSAISKKMSGSHP